MTPVCAGEAPTGVRGGIAGAAGLKPVSRVDCSETGVPFGRYKLSPLRERVRRAAGALPVNGAGRRLASLARRLCLAGWPEPVDLEVFPGEFARLYPRQNRCEKRAVAAPQYFDQVERRRLAQAIANACDERPFVFVDAGANVGLYSLFARSAARQMGKRIRILAIEPDPVNVQRLAFNASCGEGAIEIASVALGAQSGEARLLPAGRNRGEIRIAAASGGAGPIVTVVPLAGLLAERGMAYVDALKIDIEGMEFEVLDAFFRVAPPSLWPELIILEVGRDASESMAHALCLRMGYAAETATRLNSILSRAHASIRDH